MKIVRITAVLRENEANGNENQIVFVFGLNSEDRIVSGQWFGYTKNEENLDPFILENAKSCRYGGQDDYSESINIGEKNISVGTMFTVWSADGASPKMEHTYEITYVHDYSQIDK